MYGNANEKSNETNNECTTFDNEDLKQQILMTPEKKHQQK